MNRGAEAERHAEQFLQHSGLILLERNYRCRHGEIDLIMQDDAELVFVEVRLRSSDRFGGAVLSIDSKKQKRLILTAQHYLSTLNRIPPCRFDALLLRNMDGTDIEWVKNAFSL